MINNMQNALHGFNEFQPLVTNSAFCLVLILPVCLGFLLLVGWFSCLKIHSLNVCFIGHLKKKLVFTHLFFHTLTRDPIQVIKLPQKQQSQGQDLVKRWTRDDQVFTPFTSPFDELFPAQEITSILTHDHHFNHPNVNPLLFLI